VKINLPAQTIRIDAPDGIDPVWFEKLSQIATLLNNGIVGQGALATNSTAGFGYMPTCAGAPTGVPVARSGFVPFVYDTTNNKLWIYNGAWKGVALL
jgi:hypothetical protein